MSRHSINLTDQVYEYYHSVTLREDEVMQRCRAETSQHKWAGMQISPELGQFMSLLVKMLNAGRSLSWASIPGIAACAWPGQCRRAGNS